MFILLGVSASISLLVLAYDTVVRSEEKPVNIFIRNLYDELAQLRPLWIGCGGILGAVGSWVLTDKAPGLVFRFALLLGFGFMAIRGVLWTDCRVDPKKKTVSRYSERADRRSERSL